ncbi:MAG: dihydrofolate reductase [Ignavibacteriales bacterium]|nr:dihydrofolate reductase [Ignavibacteriales bacterium]
MKLIIIAAISRNRVIGKDGKLPWHISDDLKRFKQLTTGHTILMGRKTFESLARSLPNRRNVVLSTKEIPGVETYHTLAHALQALENEDRVFVIGGGEVFTQTLEQADMLYLTLVDQEVAGDTFFPPYEHLIGTVYKLTNKEARDGFTFVDYKKMRMEEFSWKELERRYNYFVDVLEKHQVIPNEGYGLQYMVKETEAVLKQEKKDVETNDFKNEAIKSIKGLQALIALTESLMILDRKGIDYHSQLVNCRTGNIDYGQRAQQQKDIYYKDFELEIFIAAQLAANTDLNIRLPQDQGPFDILLGKDVAIQVYHPSNIDNTFDKLGKFGKRLIKSNLTGIFAVGHEDAFDYGNRLQFQDEADFSNYFHSIAEKVEEFGARIIPSFQKSANVVGFIGTTTLYAMVGSDSSAGMNIRRFSSSFIVEDCMSAEIYHTVQKALTVFNPKLRHIKFENSQIKIFI